MRRCVFCGIKILRTDLEIGGEICLDCCERYDECGVYFCLD